MPSKTKSCRLAKSLSDAGFCKTAGYYCTFEQESSCKFKQEVPTMPNEMTAGEAEGKPMYDSLGDIIKALEAMYNSEKFIRKADYWARCAGEAASILRRIASGELAEVKRGRWIHSRTVSEFAVSKCSVCGKEQFSISNVVAEGKYCPNCGALMDGDSDA